MMLRLLTVAFLALPFAARAEVDIQEVTSSSGLTAWLVEEPSIPFIAINMRFQGGASLDPQSAQGATFLMTGLLEEGSGDLDARAFAEAREALAARFGFDAYRDSVSIEAQFLTEKKSDAVALLRDVLVRPRFDASDVERVRGQVMSILAGDAEDPDKIASSAMSAMAFPDHPYGYVIEGTAQSVAALTVEDLRAAHRRALTRDRVKIGVVGNITAAELGPMLDDLLGQLPLSQDPLPAEVVYDLEGGMTVLDYPTPQSVVVFSHIGLKQENEDFLPLFVLNHILGGSGFGSRLKQEVREARGLTYGIGTYPVARNHSAQWMGQFASSNEVVAEAIEVTKRIWREMAENGPTDAEVARAKTYITGAYPLRFDGNANIASILAGMQSSGLPIDYIATRNSKIDAITAGQLRDLARELMDSDGLHFVVVGQPEGLE